MELPLGTFGIAIAIVVLPSLSRKHAEDSMNEFAETLDWAFRLVCIIAIPATVALILIAEPLLITLFQSDNFDLDAVLRSAGSLRAYSLGLIAFMSIKIFAPGFYSRQNTSTPVKIGIIAMAANMVLNLVFYLNGMAHVGLALATSLAAFINAGLLLRGLVADGVFRFQSGWLLLLLRLAIANGAMAFFIISFAGDWELWTQWSVSTKVVQMSILVLGGVAIYVAALFVSGLRWKHIYR